MIDDSIEDPELILKSEWESAGWIDMAVLIDPVCELPPALAPRFSHIEKGKAIYDKLILTVGNQDVLNVIHVTIFEEHMLDEEDGYLCVIGLNPVGYENLLVQKRKPFSSRYIRSHHVLKRMKDTGRLQQFKSDFKKHKQYSLLLCDEVLNVDEDRFIWKAHIEFVKYTDVAFRERYGYVPEFEK